MICRKCNGLGSLLIRNEYCYCDNCFIANINHKFRACIGKSKTLSCNENVIICLDGDPNSTVLLDLIHNGVTLNTHKKLRVNPYFLHIKETDTEELSNIVKEQCKNYNFAVSVVNITDYYTKCSINTTDTDAKIFNNFTSNALSKVPDSIGQDVTRKIKQNIFIEVAKEFDCKFVITAETTTLLATRLLTNIAIGRGSQVEHDIGFVDSRDEVVKIIRPMRDITAEEINQYIRIKELKLANNICDKPCETSLQSVIKKFVIDLQDNYPATVSTVCKTADKIGYVVNHVNEKKCAICQSNIDFKNYNLTAVEATVFSRKVSSRQTEESINIENLQHNDNSSLFPSIYKSWCYCCSRNISELNDPMLHTTTFKNIKQ